MKLTKLKVNFSEHESWLRTPLNAVIGLTEMLKEDAEDDNLDDYLEPLDRIHNASRHLLTLINDVLDLSKIEAGKIELYFEQFLVSDIMRDIMATSEPLAENNNELILRNNLTLTQYIQTKHGAPDCIELSVECVQIHGKWSGNYLFKFASKGEKEF